MEKHLGGNNNSNGNLNLSSSDVLVSFGPPKLTNANKAVTVGLVQNLSISQQKRIIRILEYGSNLRQLVSGKTRNTLQMSRILFDGPSLLKYIAYAYLNDDLTDLKDHTNAAQYEVFMDELYKKMGYEDSNIPNEEIPGTSDFWMNLSSDLFNNPIGIHLNIKQTLPNGKKKDYGGVFLENCLINQHSLNIRSQNRILSEQIGMEFTRAVPMKSYGGEQIELIEKILKNTFKGE